MTSNSNFRSFLKFICFGGGNVQEKYPEINTKRFTPSFPNILKLCKKKYFLKMKLLNQTFHEQQSGVQQLITCLLFLKVQKRSF